MRRFDGKRVSRRWHRVLTAARKAGVKFTLNSGRRTMREQWALFRQNMRWTGSGWVPKPNRPVTAYPSPTAPHIRVGRQDHALDVNSVDGGEARLQAWLERHGAHPTNPVPGEAWHLELPARELRRLARKFTPRRPRIRKVSPEGVRLVAEFEGFRADPYLDAVGVWTIGYGHTKGVGPNTKPWTREKARRELERELNRDYARHVAALKLPLNQQQFDALTSFVYNLGPGAIAANTGIGRALRLHRWQTAADEMLEWDKAGGRVLPGLTRRRKAERRLFLTK